jgi:hypothetical protein
MGGFRISRKWAQEDLLQMPGLIEMLEDQGHVKQSEAVRLAAAHNRTGDFQRSIKGELLKAKNGRPFYRIWSDDPAALSIEFGSKNRAASRILGRAIEKWGDVNEMKHPSVKGKRHERIEKSIDDWAAKALRR